MSSTTVDEQQLPPWAWNAVATTATVLAGIAARKTLVGLYSRVRDEPPPQLPERADTPLRTALAWGAALGAAAGASRVLGRRLAARGWGSLTGQEPVITETDSR